MAYNPEAYQTDLFNLQQENKRLQEQMKQEDLLRSLRPDRPEYESLRDPSTGLLKAPYQLQGGDIYGAMKQQALSTGPSAWAQLAQQQQETAQQGAADQASRQALSSQAGARGALAMRGGLSSGARQRLAMQGGRDLLGARQDIVRQGLGQKQNIMLEDERNRQNLLRGLQPQEMAMGQFNIQQALKDKQMQDEQNMQKYQEGMKSWAAERQAQATEKSKGK